jgi:hypothetical protein
VLSSAQGVAVAESASGPWRRLGLVAAGGLGWGASGKGGGFRTNLWNGLRVDSGRALVVNGTKLYSTKGIGNGTKIPNENPGGHYQALQGVFFPKSNQSWAPPYTAYSRNPVTRAGPDGNTFTVGGAENCEFYSGPDGFFHATCAAHGALYPGGDCPHYLVSVSSEMDVQWTFVGFHCSGAAEATPVYEGAPPGDKARVNFFIARDKGGVSLYSVSWAPVNQSSGGRQIKTDDVDVSAVPTDDDARYIFFIKAPTSPAFRNVTWLQQHPQDFSEGSFRTFIDALGGHSANPKMKVGLTFQWELLDCFLSPHSCTAAQTAQGVTAFLDAAAATNTPVQITLDTVQFWYQSGLWNWWDPAQPGYDPKNVANVEWTGWSSTNATLIAWRNWGSQFRMPTPQPNLASPALLQRTGAALTSAIGAIRRWYEAASPAARKLLVGVKLGEEVDVGVNYYYYQHGNQLYKSNPHNASADPTAGPDWSKGLAGGLQAQGYNMLKTLGLRSSGGPPTRGEITQGVRHYFKSIVGACVAAWPALARNGLLATHGGACSDPLRIEWNSPMIAPATPGYSFYLSPSCFHKKSCFQPGLKTALDNYNGNSKKGRFVVAETACFGCKSVAEWEGYFHTIFANNKVGEVQYLRYYNIEPFLAAAGSVEGLQNFMKGWRKEESIPKQSTKSNDFDWIHQIVNGPPGQKYTLDAKTYLIDKQYQLPRGTELRGVGTALDHRTEIKAVGQPYNACAGTASAPGLHQGRKGLLLGDDTYVSGLHLRGMETKRLDCLYAMIETPGCQNSEGNFPSPPNETAPCGPAGRNLNCCGGYTGNDGHGVSNATVEDVTVEGYTTQNMFFMAPTAASKRVSRDITVRNMRMNGVSPPPPPPSRCLTGCSSPGFSRDSKVIASFSPRISHGTGFQSWADGVNIHGQHLNVMIEGCTVIDSGDDNFAMWSIAAGQNNVTFKNCTAIRGTEKTKPDPHGAAGINCCFVNFGGLAFSFIDNHGEGCGLTPRRGIGHGAEALVVLGCPNKGNPAFGGAWNKSSSVIVHGMTGSCAGQDGCPLCKFQPVYAYPLGFPGSVQNSACNISYGSATRFGSRLTLKLDDEPPAPSSSSYNSIGKTPIRGYQSWNDLGAKVSEALLRERADALVSTGLAALGYKYVCIDDIWAESSRDPITHELVPDKTRFPNGMKVVSSTTSCNKSLLQ